MKQELIKKIEDAKEEWIEWDWTTEICTDAQGETVYASSRGDAESWTDEPDVAQAIIDFADEVKSDASAAADAADLAIKAIAAGDLQAALEHIEDASRIERYYGDDPTYGNCRKAVEAVIDHAEKFGQL